MREQNALSRHLGSRYQKAGKKEKPQILAEFLKTTGYNRKYALRILATWGKMFSRRFREKLSNLCRSPHRSVKSGLDKLLYRPEVIEALRRIWQFFDYMYGKRLAAFLRLFVRGEEEFGITGPIKRKLLHINTAIIDRRLLADRKNSNSRTTALPDPEGF
jgi:hypothetical protein